MAGCASSSANSARDVETGRKKEAAGDEKRENEDSDVVAITRRVRKDI